MKIESCVEKINEFTTLCDKNEKGIITLTKKIKNLIETGKVSILTKQINENDVFNITYSNSENKSFTIGFEEIEDILNKCRLLYNKSRQNNSNRLEDKRNPQLMEKFMIKFQNSITELINFMRDRSTFRRNGFDPEQFKLNKEDLDLSQPRFKDSIVVIKKK